MVALYVCAGLLRYIFSINTLYEKTQDYIVYNSGCNIITIVGIFIIADESLVLYICMKKTNECKLFSLSFTF